MSDEALRPVCSAWTNKIRLAWDFKKKQFQDDADEAMCFFNGPYDFLYGLKNPRASTGFAYAGEDGDLPKPTFAMTVNKVAELVQLYGPALYHRNPVRQVNPRKTPLLPISAFGDAADPAVQQLYQATSQQLARNRGVDEARAALLQAWLNYTPTALDLKTESRAAVDEALIKGMGLLYPEVYTPPSGGTRMVGSFYDTVDNLVIDPDFETLREAKWVARRCVHPYWEVERTFGLPEDSLKKIAGIESYNRQGEVAAHIDGDYRRKQGLTNDLLVYWKIYSKMGAGGRLSGVTPSVKPLVDQFGDFIYLCVADGCPWPLNLPPPLIEAAFGQAGEEDPLLSQAALQEVGRRLQWPTPYWADEEWPFAPLCFHNVPRRVWPTSHISPGMGELKFINWAYSFLAGKVRTSCRDFIAVAKSAGEEMKDRLRTGPDYTVLEVEALHESIDKVVRFLQHPEFNAEIYKVIEGVTVNFERRTGLTELMYGLSTKQIRSAEEAQVKSDNVTVRPDDMANKVEDWMGKVARLEALCCRWHLTGQDVAPALGPMGAQWWDQLLTPSDPAEVLHQLEYRIESGSAKKPNKARDVANMAAAMQQLFPTLWNYATVTGDVSQVNALIATWAKSIDLDATAFLLKTPAPPPPPVQGPQPAPGGGGLTQRPAPGPNGPPARAPAGPPRR